ncbi:hypothetical protein ACLOAV_010215 [Pseudogymnoascus australis]
MAATQPSPRAPQPTIIAMEVDDEDSWGSEYRLQRGTQIPEPTTETRSPFPSPPSPPPIDANWTVAHISRSPSGILLTTLATRKLAGIKSLWDPTTVSCLDLEKTDQLTAAAYEVVPLPASVLTVSSPGAPVITKIARFEWEIPRLEQETRTYQQLEGSGLAPRFLGISARGTA